MDTPEVKIGNNDGNWDWTMCQVIAQILKDYLDSDPRSYPSDRRTYDEWTEEVEGIIELFLSYNLEDDPVECGGQQAENLDRAFTWLGNNVGRLWI